MNVHEYQAKKLFREYGINIPRSILAKSADEAVIAAQELGGRLWAIKAQVHAGGRGKAGGIKLAKSLDEVRQYAQSLIGSELKSAQTAGTGLPINMVLVEEKIDIADEFYLSATIDRSAHCISFICSSEGGMDIEVVAEALPEKIITLRVNPMLGYSAHIGRKAGFLLGLKKAQLLQLTQLMENVYRLFVEKDLSLVEINPLVLTGRGDLVALDGKIAVDDNALYRHKALEAMRDDSQENELENQARLLGLNYVALDGNIGCMVNGAGLAMATMDIIKLQGGEPANFLDVGGGATAEGVKEAFKLILSSPNVKSILVNIFGGIVRCDLIADGIIKAAREINLSTPVIARLQGTNVDLGQKMLNESGLPIQAADDLADAAQKAVAAAQ